MALLSEAPSLSIHFLQPGFKNSLREKLYQLCGCGGILIDIDLQQPGPLWSDKMAQSYAAADTDENRGHFLADLAFVNMLPCPSCQYSTAGSEIE